MTALEALAWLAVGAVIGIVAGAIAGYVTRDRENCLGCEARDRTIARADACLARAQAELETGDGLADAADLADLDRVEQVVEQWAKEGA